MKTFQLTPTRVNLIVDNAPSGWQAKLYRAETGALTYATAEYANKRDAYDDALRWSTANRCLIRSMIGVGDLLPPRPRGKPRRLGRSYSANWGRV